MLLASSLGGIGHLTPVVRVARAFERAGAETLILVPPALGGAIAGTGLRYEIAPTLDEVLTGLPAGGGQPR